MRPVRQFSDAAEAPILCPSCKTYIETGAEHWCPPKAAPRTDAKPETKVARKDRFG